MSSLPSIAVFADFDDTLTTKNAAQFLLKRFAPDALQRFTTEYRSGEITFRQYQELSFNAVEATVSEMQEVAKEEIELRPGLAELLNAIDSAQATFTVASAGLDIYIEPVLQQHGLTGRNVICGTASIKDSEGGEFRYDYPFTEANAVDPCRGDWATCKCKALETAGDAITVFVGDGSTSDACVAPKADYVFARDRLLRICRQAGIEATPFEDFSPVTDLINRLNAELQQEQKSQR